MDRDSYWKNLEIYSKAGKNIRLKRLFAKGPSKYNCQKLIHEINKLGIKPIEEKTVVAEPKKKAHPKKLVLIPGKYESVFANFKMEELPLELRDLYKELIEKDQKSRQQHWDLGQLLEDDSKTEERRKLAAAIVENKDRVIEIYQILDAWKATGKLPEKKGKEQKDFKSMSQAELKVELQKLHASISKSRKRVDAAAEALKKEKVEIKKPALLKKLSKLQDTLGRYEYAKSTIKVLLNGATE